MAKNGNRSVERFMRIEVFPNDTPETEESKGFAIQTCQEAEEMIRHWARLPNMQHLRLGSHLESCDHCRAKALAAEEKLHQEHQIL